MPSDGLVKTRLDPPTISVVIPHFQGGAQILDAVESVANQTVPPLEILVVDDHSPEENASLLNLVKEPSTKIIYLPRNTGQSAARNIGVQKARGEWVCFLDQDDVYLPTHNAELLAVISRFPESQAIFGRFTLGDQKRHGIRSPGRRKISILDPAKTLRSIWRGLTIVPGCMMIRRDVFLQSGGFDEDLRGFEDEHLVARLLEKGYNCAITQSTILEWRQSLSSASYQLSFLESRELYLRKLQLQFGERKSWSRSLRLMRLRFELLGCWDSLALNLTREQIQAAARNFNSMGIRPLFSVSPLGWLGEKKDITRDSLRKLIFSPLFKFVLRIVGVVRAENAIRLGSVKK